ncbi:hypothetical protein DY000_02057148 [Brassica cretica]|uniref:Filament-like plant protein 7 n=1 Tax=Brassica cretica TaxID=69181 RepID=A0ABQ7ADJ1_BRACR|nr:hypothetical protein DY000_02057148 [Brassica cretica]
MISLPLSKLRAISIRWEKTKAESASLKKKLEEALTEKHRSDERSSYTEAGLKECMQQLRFLRDEQEQRMHDALTKASHEYERRLNVVKTEIADTCKKLAEAEGENTRLSKALLAKNKTVEEFNRDRDRIVSDFNALVSSLESKEKENVTLRYEVRVVEKELELRNEEREFSRRTAEASHKLHLENVKKVAKLEQECQRLRVLVRKRLPGPAALSKMRHEVEMLGSRRSSNSTTIDSEKNNNLTEQLCLLEEENKTLRDALNKKVNELQFSRNMYSRTASRLLELEESCKGTTNIEPSRSSNVSHEVSLASFPEFDNNDDKVSCSDSWASALLSELENFKNKKQMGSTPKASEMKLMDDFAEMEKLASTVPGSSPIFSSDSISATGPLENDSNEDPSEAAKTQRNAGEVLEDISKALSGVNQTETLTVEGAEDTECDTSKWIRRIVEIIEGFSLKGESERLSGYTARLLQWKTTELSSVLQRFLQTCYDLIDRKADMKKFAEELSTVLVWMVNHCFSLQNVSSMRKEIKKQFEWDESLSGSDVSSLACKDHELPSKVVEEEAKDKPASASANEFKLEEQKNMRTELEITAASEKLAECQETILNLGKQLNALTNSKETALLSDKLTPGLSHKPNNLATALLPSQGTKPEKRLTTQRSSLLDQMKAEDHDTGEPKDQKKPQAADKNGKGGGSVYNETIDALEQILLSDRKSKGSETNCCAIVPQKKNGGVKSLWRKLLGRKKNSKSKKLPNIFAT